MTPTCTFGLLITLVGRFLFPERHLPSFPSKELKLFCHRPLQTFFVGPIFHVYCWSVKKTAKL